MPVDEPIACLRERRAEARRSAAWRMAPRDRFIGWSDEARQRNLFAAFQSAVGAPPLELFAESRCQFSYGQIREPPRDAANQI